MIRLNAHTRNLESKIPLQNVIYHSRMTSADIFNATNFLTITSPACIQGGDLIVLASMKIYASYPK